ncbi:hypothetical protein JW979_11555, partial [bacterium]|nr:hypothetical protein [candidate division CSSED10-310 bacterium]
MNQTSTSILFQWIWRYLGKYKRRMAIGLICLFAASSLSMTIPWIVKLAIDDLTHNTQTNRVTMFIGLIGIIALFQGVFRYTMRQQLIGASRLAEYRIRADLFAHVQQLPQTFFNRYRTGDIMSRLTNDILAIRMVMGPAILQMGNTAVSLVFAMIMMTAIDPLLTLISLAPLPLMPLTLYFLGRKVRERSERVQEQMAEINTFAQENLTGMRIVKAYNLQENQEEAFSKLSREYVERNLKLVMVQGMFMPVMVLLAGVATIVVLLFGGWWLITERITLGSLVAFLEYLVLLTWPMFAIGWVTGLVQQGSASIARISRIFNESGQPDMLPESSRFSPDEIWGDIRAEGINFSYGRQ